MKSALALTVAVALLVARPALADVRLRTSVSSDQVEVNEPFRVQLRITSSDGDADVSDARLPAPAGLGVRGPNQQSSTQISVTQGRMMRSTMQTLSWTVVASRPGVYRIGPPSAVLGGQRHQGQQVTVKVIPQGSSPPRPPRGAPLDPFDLFGPMGGFPRFPFGLDEPSPDEEEEEAPRYPAELGIDTPPDPIAFVKAIARPQRLVVGEQIDLAVYAYGGRGSFEAGDMGEPSRDGFLAYKIEEQRTPSWIIPIQDRRWLVARFHHAALFPTRAGTLHIGAARFGFRGRGYPTSSAARGLVRKSQPLDIVVVEPPIAGRPPGYRIGDVGRYSLEATVEPRRIRQGEAVSVVATLEGRGNVPTTLNVPQSKGLEWMTPAVAEDIDASSGTVRGSRTFTYVVQVTRAGEVDLGEITLPYYDAGRKRYEVARARLGVVNVTPDRAVEKDLAGGKKADRLAGLLTPRTERRGPVSAKAFLSDRRGFWLGLLAGPLGVLGLGGAFRLGSAVRERLSRRRNTLEHQAAHELSRARAAARRADLPEMAAILERAVHLLLEARTGLKSRGVLRDDLPRRLKEQGLTDELSSEVVAVLEITEQARFSGGDEAPKALLGRVEHLLSGLRRGRLG